ncbi:hypothetical protein VTL71DRAFT_3571 [Oculimacula yallundae]|uniref:Uncharacterized protein n=1 Tax=Oculimacula yallundae TaxID=86028 RepID=A0ABR4C8T7_9HELO
MPRLQTVRFIRGQKATSTTAVPAHGVAEDPRATSKAAAVEYSHCNSSALRLGDGGLRMENVQNDDSGGSWEQRLACGNGAAMPRHR